MAAFIQMILYSRRACNRRTTFLVLRAKYKAQCYSNRDTVKTDSRYLCPPQDAIGLLDLLIVMGVELERDFGQSSCQLLLCAVRECSSTCGIDKCTV